MTARTLIWRNLRFHWRSHLGVLLGAAIGSAALVGALVVGDSVQGSLRARALERLGEADAALFAADRLVTADLAERMFRLAPLDSGAEYGPALLLPGTVVALDTGRRANSIQVIGVDGRLSSFGGEFWRRKWEPGTSGLSETLAAHLGVRVGQTVIVRAHKPTALSADAPLSPRSDSTLTLRLRVAALVPARALGNLSLEVSGQPALNLFLDLETLQQAAGVSGRVNCILAKTGRNEVSNPWVEWLDRIGVREFGDDPGNANGLAATARDRTTVALDPVRTHAARLRKAWRFADTQCTITPSEAGAVELRSERVFLDPALERASLAVQTNARPILTYIANFIGSGSNAAPYSMVTAAGPPWTPVELAEDEMVLNPWLADDLQVGPGDRVTLVYYDPESGAVLVERTNTFRVHSVVPLQLPWADRTLMPDFPGLERAERAADWDTAFPLTYKIRPQDDEYWRRHRGTPKAFISLTAGQRLWANRFGQVTAIRFPMPASASANQGIRPNPSAGANLRVTQAEREPGEADPAGARRRTLPDTAYRSWLERQILERLDPAELGLRFEAVREQALRAAAEAQDFGGLFLGFSLFLIAAALILMTLLFQFGLEQRASEVGTLLALGFTRQRVRRLMLGEGAMLAFLGGWLGVAGGLAYARLLLLGLATVWHDAVGGTALEFFVSPTSLVIGLTASTVVATVTLWLALRRQARQPAIALLTSTFGLRTSDLGLRPAGHPLLARGILNSSRRSAVIRFLANAASLGTLSLLGAVGWVSVALATEQTTNPGVFFGAGTLVLIGGVALFAAWLGRVGRVAVAQGVVPNGPIIPTRPGLTLNMLAWRGAARRRSRSVATAALLASGAFVVLSVGVFRLDARREANRPTSGTGGFALIGEATLPIPHDLNTPVGRDSFGLDTPELAGVRFVPFRVRAGDDASCLNLNRARQPRLLGVRPQELEGRFTIVKGTGWEGLKSEVRGAKCERQDSEAAVAAIGDAASIQWAMGRKVGDSIAYVDDRGRAFEVRIVGAVAHSILQGSLIIDEAEFVRRFPDRGGYHYFLIDAPDGGRAELAGRLSRAFEDHGLEIASAGQRLNQFNAVQNTYLGTFQILGGLGLLLGSAGLGMVVLRNVLERRGELAVLRAVGFQRATVERLVLLEHAGLLVVGLAIGALAAAVAVLPTLMLPGTPPPPGTLGLTLLLVLVNGLGWAWAATRAALRGNLLEILREEC